MWKGSVVFFLCLQGVSWLGGCFIQPSFESRVYEVKDPDTGKVVVYLEALSHGGKPSGPPTIVLKRESTGERYRISASEQEPSRWYVYKYGKNDEVKKLPIWQIYRGNEGFFESHPNLP